jgi:prepilin-type N-terminal cleavage/methylation domain-containing protein
MKAQSQFRNQAGFTLIELLVVISVIGILVGLILPTVHRVEKAASAMAEFPRLEGLAVQIHQFNQAAESNAQAFIISAATDAETANDSDTAEVNLVVNLGALKYFCDADTNLISLQNQVNGLLGDKGGPADLRSFRDQSSDEQRLLTETKHALDKELPAVQKLAELLRNKAGGLCSSTIQ